MTGTDADTPAAAASATPDAAAIYQAHLDTGSAHLLAGDPQAYCDLVALPLMIRTAAGETVLETRADAEADMARICDWLSSQGATQYIRLVKAAHFITPTLIEGWHRTYALRNATSLVDPYDSRLILRHEDGRWLLIEGEHELANAPFPAYSPRSSIGSFNNRWANRPQDIRAEHDAAEPLYQAFLDSMNTAIAARDFEGWIAYFTLPHHVHYEATDHVISGIEEVRPFFALVWSRMDKLGADRLDRRVSKASFVSHDRVVGYHDTYMARGADRLLGPVKSRMVLELGDGCWRCSSVTNSLSHSGVSGGEFGLTDMLPTLREIQERMKK